MIGRMFSSRGLRGRILHKVLHKQHNRIYNYDASTEYGTFTPCSEEAALQFLRMAHFDEGGRIFTYVITLDGMMRFTETGKEFGIDLLSKHTMHSDVAVYIACAGEFFIRRLAHPVHHHKRHNSDNHDNGGNDGNDDENAEASSSATPNQPPHPNSSAPNDEHPNASKSTPDNDHPDASKSTPEDQPSPNPSGTAPPTHPPHHPVGGPPGSPPPPNPALYQLIIDNDSGTYRPDASILSDLQSFLSRNLPGLEVTAMHCADDRLAEMKKAQREAKKREGKGVVRMVMDRSPSCSSASSAASSLGRMELANGGGHGGGGGVEEEEDGGPSRSKRERVFDVVSEPRRWKEMLGQQAG